MGIKNDFSRKIITEYSSDSIIRLFEGNLDIFLTDMEWLPYKEIFEDSKKFYLDQKNSQNFKQNIGDNQQRMSHHAKTTSFGWHDGSTKIISIIMTPVIAKTDANQALFL